jgi:hypothetical protein
MGVEVFVPFFFNDTKVRLNEYEQQILFLQFVKLKQCVKFINYLYLRISNNIFLL